VNKLKYVGLTDDTETRKQQNVNPPGWWQIKFKNKTKNGTDK
jgi:hypothetical protein